MKTENLKCSIIRFVGLSKHSNEVEACENAGLDVIPLWHWKKFGASKMQVIGGFQGGLVTVNRDDVRGGIQYTYKLDKDNLGVNTALGKSLYFVPDPATAKLVCFIPKTEYNLKALARQYGTSNAYTIMDKEIDNEVKELKKKMPIKDAKNLTDIDLLKKVNSETEEENKRLRKLLKESLDKDIIKKDQLKKMAKDSIYEEHKDLIDKLRVEKGDSFYATTEYKEQVKPLIDARIEELKKDYKVID